MIVTPIRLPSQLGDVLRGARLHRGLTQNDVARQLGMSAQALSKLEHNADRASFERIYRLCQVLGLEVVLQPKSQGVAEASPVEW